MKKRTVAALLFLICVFFFPCPIINNIEECEVDFVQYNVGFGQTTSEMKTLSEFNKAKILECLSQYKEYRTLIPAESVRRADAELYIFLDDRGKLKHIVLGNVNYWSGSYGSLRACLKKGGDCAKATK